MDNYPVRHHHQGSSKGDQQIRTSDVDPTFAPEPSGEVDFVTMAAACNRDKKAKPNHEAADEQGKKNKGDKSGRPDSPGNSANAPGHNK